MPCIHRYMPGGDASRWFYQQDHMLTIGRAHPLVVNLATSSWPDIKRLVAPLLPRMLIGLSTNATVDDAMCWLLAYAFLSLHLPTYRLDKSVRTLGADLFTLLNSKLAAPPCHCGHDCVANLFEPRLAAGDGTFYSEEGRPQPCNWDDWMCMPYRYPLARRGVSAQGLLASLEGFLKYQYLKPHAISLARSANSSNTHSQASLCAVLRCPLPQDRLPQRRDLRLPVSHKPAPLALVVLGPHCHTVSHELGSSLWLHLIWVRLAVRDSHITDLRARTQCGRYT